MEQVSIVKRAKFIVRTKRTIPKQKAVKLWDYDFNFFPTHISICWAAFLHLRFTEKRGTEVYKGGRRLIDVMHHYAYVKWRDYW